MDTNLDPLGGLLVSSRITAKPAQKPAKAQFGEKSVILGTPGESSKRVARSSSPASKSSVIILLSVSIPEREVQKVPKKEAELTSSPLGPVPVVSSDVQGKPSAKLLDQPISGFDSSSSSSSSSWSASISSPAVPGKEGAVEGTADPDLAKMAKVLSLLKDIHKPEFSPVNFFESRVLFSGRGREFFNLRLMFQRLISKYEGIKVSSLSLIGKATLRCIYELHCMDNKLLRTTEDFGKHFKRKLGGISDEGLEVLFDPKRAGFNSKLLGYDKVISLIIATVIRHMIEISREYTSLDKMLLATALSKTVQIDQFCCCLLHSLLVLKDKNILEGEGGIYHVFDVSYALRETLQITHFENARSFILSVLEGEDPEKTRAISGAMAKSWKLGELEVGKEGKAREQGAKTEK